MALLGCDTVQSGKSSLTFWIKILPPSSGSKIRSSRKKRAACRLYFPRLARYISPKRRRTSDYTASISWTMVSLHCPFILCTFWKGIKADKVKHNLFLYLENKCRHMSFFLERRPTV
jgi:hypothetical protein